MRNSVIQKASENMADTEKCTEDWVGGRDNDGSMDCFGSDPNICEWNLLSKEERNMSL